MRKAIFALIGLILVAALGRGYWAYQQAVTLGVRKSSTELASSSVASVLTVEARSQDPVVVPVVADTINCGSDYQCFIQAATECQKAKMTQEISTSVSFFKLTTKSEYTIEGISSGSCISSSHTLNVHAELTGLTEIEKLAAEQSLEFKNIQTNAAKEIGRIIRCELPTNRVVEIYTKLSQGTVSTKSSDSCSAFDINGKPWIE